MGYIPHSPSSTNYVLKVSANGMKYKIHRGPVGKGLDNFLGRFKMTGNPRESVPFALSSFEGRFRIYELKVALSSSER
jgi:hypothetical protein